MGVNLRQYVEALQALGVRLVEQPLHRQCACLASLESPNGGPLIPAERRYVEMWADGL